MNCLLTGRNGFLGKNMFEEISLLNKVYGLSKNGTDYNYYLDKEIPCFNFQFDLVVHTAGKAHSNSKEDYDKNEFYEVNVLGTQNLLRGLNNSGIPKYFVFISSVSVYGLDYGYNIDENSPLMAFDPYGISKIEAERVVINWCKKHNVVCTILRLPLIVGTNPPGNLGSMIKGIKKGYYFNIAGGSAKKSMVLASDVAKFVLMSFKVGGIFNLTDGYHPSFSELSKIISNQLGKKKPKNLPFFVARVLAVFGDFVGMNAVINSNKLVKITSDLTFSDHKARVTLGWIPTSVLDGFMCSDINL